MVTGQSKSTSPGRPLAELPNREGFKFRGIRKDGGRYMNCRSKHLPGVGMFIVAAGSYAYEDVSDLLSGWEPHPSRTGVRT
jgi:hypothetical protein